MPRLKFSVHAGVDALLFDFGGRRRVWADAGLDVGLSMITGT